MESKLIDSLIYSRRFRLICGSEGGMPLNMTRPAQIDTIRKLLLHARPNQFGAISLGMGDAMALALFAARGARFVGGVEVCSYAPHCLAQEHARNMLAVVSNFAPERAMLKWGVDASKLSNLTEILPDIVDQDIDLVSYSLDDSIPLPARINWYRLIEQEKRVVAISTTLHHKLDTKVLLPSFELMDSYRINLEGGNCSRTMRIYKRRA
jgi:hypothetical protein